LGQLSRPFTWPGAWLTPRLSLNAASYSFDSPGQDRQRKSRLIPTTSLDAGMVLERETTWFGRPQRQTLEPRLLYVNTPFRDQTGLPNFDAAERDFNAVSIYAESAFSGIDRVSDAHQVTTGVTTRTRTNFSSGHAGHKIPPFKSSASGPIGTTRQGPAQSGAASTTKIGSA
jgi:LPS-assembly protein